MKECRLNPGNPGLGRLATTRLPYRRILPACGVAAGNKRRDSLSLQVYARSAGAALACAFSSSAEYDAALIAERRAAGVYGPKRRRKRMLVTAGGIAAALAVIVLLIV